MTEGWQEEEEEEEEEEEGNSGMMCWKRLAIEWLPVTPGRLSVWPPLGRVARPRPEVGLQSQPLISRVL